MRHTKIYFYDGSRVLVCKVNTNLSLYAMPKVRTHEKHQRQLLILMERHIQRPKQVCGLHDFNGFRYDVCLFSPYKIHLDSVQTLMPYARCHFQFQRNKKWRLKAKCLIPIHIHTLQLHVNICNGLSHTDRRLWAASCCKMKTKVVNQITNIVIPFISFEFLRNAQHYSLLVANSPVSFSLSLLL